MNVVAEINYETCSDWEDDSLGGHSTVVLLKHIKDKVQQICKQTRKRKVELVMASNVYDFGFAKIKVQVRESRL